jgi:hypothetical protein
LETIVKWKGTFSWLPRLCDWDSVDMDALFNDLDSMDTSIGNDCQMDTSGENDGQMEVPLSVDDYQQLVHGCHVEAHQNCMNPQYADVIIEA